MQVPVFIRLGIQGVINFNECVIVRVVKTRGGSQIQSNFLILFFLLFYTVIFLGYFLGGP